MFSEILAVAASAEDEATRMGLHVVVSVVDTHGNPALLHRMDEAPMHSLEMAFRKAYTAASFNVATEELTERVRPDGDLYGLAVNSGSKLIGFGGGAPFVVSSGERFGLGISGGTTEQDIDIMKVAISRHEAR
jgi:uncharacterized protein GlcG (DUF336 family)